MKQQRNSLKFIGKNPIPQNVDAWRKVTKAGNFKSWMDYQKWLLAQVTPISKYKKTV